MNKYIKTLNLLIETNADNKLKGVGLCNIYVGHSFRKRPCDVKDGWGVISCNRCVFNIRHTQDENMRPSTLIRGILK